MALNPVQFMEDMLQALLVLLRAAVTVSASSLDSWEGIAQAGRPVHGLWSLQGASAEVRPLREGL